MFIKSSEALFMHTLNSNLNISHVLQVYIKGKQFKLQGNIILCGYLLDSRSTSTNHIFVELLENRNFHTEIGSNLFIAKNENKDFNDAGCD